MLKVRPSTTTATIAPSSYRMLPGRRRDPGWVSASLLRWPATVAANHAGVGFHSDIGCLLGRSLAGIGLAGVVRRRHHPARTVVELDELELLADLLGKLRRLHLAALQLLHPALEAGVVALGEIPGDLLAAATDASAGALVDPHASLVVLGACRVG